MSTRSLVSGAVRVQQINANIDDDIEIVNNQPAKNYKRLNIKADTPIKGTKTNKGALEYQRARVSIKVGYSPAEKRSADP